MFRSKLFKAASLHLCCVIILWSSLAQCTRLLHQTGEVPRRYVVVLKPDVTDTTGASQRLRTFSADSANAATVAAASATSSRSSSTGHSFLLHRVIGSEQSIDSISVANGSTTTPPIGLAAPVPGVQGLLISATPSVASKLWQSPDVTAVIPDMLVQHQRRLVQAPNSEASPDSCMNCSQALQLRTRGISITPNSRFKWPGCYHPSDTKLVWYGNFCGPQNSQVVYTPLEAFDAATGAPKPGCQLTATMDKPTSWIRRRFGSCGKAPLHAPDLPTQLCDLGIATRNCWAGISDDPTTEPTADPTAEPAYALATNPRPRTQVLALPRVAVAAKESIPSGVTRIQAYRQGTIVRIPRDLPQHMKIAVGVIDSGIYGLHPDLNVVGGMSFVRNDSTLSSMGQGRDFQVVADDLDPRVDKYGHGTHIAGIIGARNQGSGIIGVSPGVPLYALKVNNAFGKGAMSWVLEAVKWVVTTGLPQYNIRVINLSLSFYISPLSPAYQQMKDAVCAYFDQAARAGVVVLTAAGNQGTSMEGHFPASCPAVAAVTALDTSGKAPAGYSNYWAADTVSSEARARTFLAPGTGINSTMSPQVAPTLYYTLQGTSQASPHVAAVAANCLMSGACPASLSGRDVVSVLYRAAERKAAAQPAFGVAASSAGGRFYGPIIYAVY